MGRKVKDVKDELKEVCRGSMSSTNHNMDKEADQEQETDIETVNISSVKFSFSCSTIIANQKTSSNKVVTKVPYKAGMGSDGNIIPLDIYKRPSPWAAIEQFVPT